MRSALLVTLVALSSLCSLHAASIDDDLRALREARDALASQVFAKGAAAGELRLVMAQAADGSDLHVALPVTGAAPTAGIATVPAWRAESILDGFKQLFLNGAGAPAFDRHLFACDANGLRLDGAVLSGKMNCSLKLDQTRSELMPPGTPVVLRPTGERYSWYDYTRSVPHQRPRTVAITLDAQVRNDVWQYHLRFDALVEGRPFDIRFAHPPRPFDDCLGGTPSWNGGYHRADTSGLRRDGDHLHGTFVAVLQPDPWVPKDGKAKPIAVSVDAQVDGCGRVSGTWVLGEGATAQRGQLGGWAGALVEGRYRATGDLGQSAGGVLGMFLPRPANAAALLGPDPATGDAAATLAVATRTYQQARALRLALDDVRIAPAQALALASGPAPQFADAAGPDAAAYVAALRAVVATLRDAKPAAQSAAKPMGHAVRSQALAENTLKDDATPGWYHLPTWQVLGPLAQNAATGAIALAAPDVVPARGATYVELAQPKAGKGKGKGGDDRSTSTWAILKADGPRLDPPWESEPLFAGWRNQAWYASTSITSSAERDVLLAVDGADHLAVWVNGALAHLGSEGDWVLCPRKLQAVSVHLTQGANHVVVRVRSDRGCSWASVQLGLGQQSPPALATSSGTPLRGAAYRGDGSSRMATAGAAVPQAWNLSDGTNISWQVELPGGGPMPVADSDLVLVMAGPTTVRAFDPASGAERWTLTCGAASSDKDSTATPPALDAQQVYAHSSDGTVLCADRAGTTRWTAATGLRRAVLYPLGDALLVVGGSEGGAGRDAPAGGGAAGVPKRRSDPQHAAILLDAATGTQRWRTALRGVFSARSTSVQRLGSGGQTTDVLVSADAQVLRLADGTVVLDGFVRDHSAHATVCAADGVLCLLEQARRSAWQLGLASDGSVVAAPLWVRQSEISGFFHQPAFGVIADGLVHVLAKVPEHGPHCPMQLAELESYRISTGELVQRIKPVMRDVMRHNDPPLAAGTLLYLSDLGGGFGLKDDQGQTTVVQLGPVPRVACTNALPHIGSADPTPCVVGDRLYLRSDSRLWCIAITTPAGATYQRERLAERLLADCEPGIAPVSGSSIAPLDASRVLNTASSPVCEMDAAEDWLVPQRCIAMPAHWVAASELQAADPAALAGNLPTVGSPAPGGGNWAAVAEQHLLRGTPGVLENTFLQGRGIRIIHQPLALDPACYNGGDAAKAGWLGTVLDLPRPGVYSLGGGGPGVGAFVNGTPVKLGERLSLAAGRYTVLLRVGPELLVRPRAQAPINVAAAIAGTALTAIPLDRWTVFGPLPKGSPLPAPEVLATAPAKMNGPAGELEPHMLAMTDGVLDLAPLLTRADGTAAFGEELAVAYQRISVPSAGRLYGNASADWRMAWFVDGQQVYSTLERGNGGDPATVALHSWSAVVGPGEHTLVAVLSTGSKGWSLRAQCGFSADANRDLSTDFAEPKGITPPTAPAALRIELRQHRDAAAHRAARAALIAQHRDAVLAITRDLVGSPLAAKAAQLLAYADASTRP